MSASPRKADGSAGDADCAASGTVCRDDCVADPRVAAFVHAALGNARTVLDVGAGTGSREPADRAVTPAEPSATMRCRRPAHPARAVDAVAERLPFPDRRWPPGRAARPPAHAAQPGGRAGAGGRRALTRGQGIT